MRLVPLILFLSLASAMANPVLVRDDGTYPTTPLAKDVVVVKVVQNGVRNLQDFDDVREGLAVNLERMLGWIEKACSEGQAARLHSL